MLQVHKEAFREGENRFGLSIQPLYGNSGCHKGKELSAMAQVSPLNDFIILLVKFGYVLAAYGNLGNKVLIYFTTRVSSNQSFAHLRIDDGNKVLISSCIRVRR